MATAVLPDAGARTVVTACLRRMARVQSRLSLLSAELDRDLDGVRMRYEARIATLRERLNAMADELEGLCRSRPAEIFDGDRRSYRTPYGEVAFRRAEPAIEIRDDLTDPDVCRLLRRGRLARLVRTKEGPDRQAIRRAFTEGEVSAERLERCGLAVLELPDHFRCSVGGGAGERVR